MKYQAQSLVMISGARRLHRVSLSDNIAVQSASPARCASLLPVARYERIRQAKSRLGKDKVEW